MNLEIVENKFELYFPLKIVETNLSIILRVIQYLRQPYVT